MIAGPSEVLVIADHTANPTYVAADLLSQAEHDRLASAVLLTDSMAQAQAISCEMERQAKLLPRWDIIKESVANYGCAIGVRRAHGRLQNGGRRRARASGGRDGRAA